jgi:hypothetical protein
MDGVGTLGRQAREATVSRAAGARDWRRIMRQYETGETNNQVIKMM